MTSRALEGMSTRRTSLTNVLMTTTTRMALTPPAVEDVAPPMAIPKMKQKSTARLATPVSWALDRVQKPVLVRADTALKTPLSKKVPRSPKASSWANDTASSVSTTKLQAKIMRVSTSRRSSRGPLVDMRRYTAKLKVPASMRQMSTA